MIQKTYGQVKEELSEIAGNTGMPVTEGLLKRYVNNAVQELMNEGDWPGVVDRWHLYYDRYSGEVALPSFLDRLMSVTVEGCPKEIASPWYEFVAYGPGNLHDVEVDPDGNVARETRGWTNVVLERGESCLQLPLDWYGVSEYPNGVSLYAYAPLDEFDDPLVMNVQGLDMDGNIMRTETFPDSGIWVTGANLPLSQESAGSANFSKVTAVIKPVTKGPVYLRAAYTFYPGTTNLACYQFNETTPSFRKYFVPSLFVDTERGERRRIIRARCRRRFIPVTEDTDVLIIGNIMALGEMMIAQYKRQVGALQEYLAHKQTAVDLMRMESHAYLGKSRVPTISFQRGFNLGTLPMIR